MVGLLFGSAIFGQLSDYMGRKKSYYLAYTIMLMSGALSAASVNWQMYAALRFVASIFVEQENTPRIIEIRNILFDLLQIILHTMCFVLHVVRETLFEVSK